jgi:hypothetical protein
MGKKDVEKKGSLKKVIIFLGITHPIEALLAARKARKLGLNPKRWFLATLLFGVFASSRMKRPVAVEVEVEEAPKGRKEKKAKKEKKAADTKIVIEVIEEVEAEAGKQEKGKKSKKSKKSK